MSRAQRAVTLALGTFVSQALLSIALLFSIILYTPEQIGLYGSALAIVYAAAHFSGLRLDGLLLSDRDRSELYHQLNRIILKFQLIGVAAISLLVLKDVFYTVILCGVFYFYSLALFQSQHYLQQQKLRRVTYARISGSFILLVGQMLGAGLHLGLICGDLVGKWLHSKLLPMTVSIPQMTKRTMTSMLKVHQKALLHLNFSTLGQVAAFYGPLLVIHFLLGPVEAASFYLIQRAAGFTEQFVGYTSYQLTISEVEDNHTITTFQSLALRLGKLSAITLLFLAGTGLGIFCLSQFSFFSEWEHMTSLFFLYVPLCWMQILLMPLRILLTSHKQWQRLAVGEVVRGMGTLAWILGAIVFFTEEYFWLYCIGGCLFSAWTVGYYLVFFRVKNERFCLDSY